MAAHKARNPGGRGHFFFNRVSVVSSPLLWSLSPDNGPTIYAATDLSSVVDVHGVHLREWRLGAQVSHNAVLPEERSDITCSGRTLTYHLPVVVDVEGKTDVAAQCAEISHDAVVPKECPAIASSVGTVADDLPVPVDRERYDFRPAQGTEVCHNPALPQKGSPSTRGSRARPENLSAVVDGDRLRLISAQCAEVDYGAVLPQDRAPRDLARDGLGQIHAHNLPAIIDVLGPRGAAARQSAQIHDGSVLKEVSVERRTERAKGTKADHLSSFVDGRRSAIHTGLPELWETENSSYTALPEKGFELKKFQVEGTKADHLAAVVDVTGPTRGEMLPCEEICHDTIPPKGGAWLAKTFKGAYDIPPLVDHSGGTKLGWGWVGWVGTNTSVIYYRQLDYRELLWRSALCSDRDSYC
jgi:hypothetical protein